MNYIKTLMILGIVFMLLPIATLAQENTDGTLPVSINQVKVDGTEISNSEWNKLSIERDSEFEVKITLEAFEDHDDLEIMVWINGYEYNHQDRVSDETGLFDVEEGNIYIKKLTLNLPENLDVDDYKLRIIISDRNSYEQVYNYNLQIDAPRHELKIRDLMLNPNYNIKSGTGFVSKVRIENKGQKTEEDIKVTIGIPELNLLATEYIDSIKSEDTKEIEEIFLRLPQCVKAGEYIVVAEVLYDDGHETITAFTKINVLENAACNKEEKQVEIVVPEETQEKQEQIQQPAVKEEKQGKSTSLRAVLEVSLIVLIALLIVVGLIIGISKWRQDE